MLPLSFHIGSLGILLTLAATPTVYAATPTPSSASSSSSGVGYGACRTEIDWIAWKEQREFRSVLFGQTAAEKALVSEVRFANEDKSIWIKTQVATSSMSSSPAKPDIWESVAEGYKSTTWTDTDMEDATDIVPRKGIFAVRRRLPTELIPHLAQAYRTLECRLENLCRLVQISTNIKDSDAQDVTVKILGCLDVETQTLPACHLPSVQGTLPTQGNMWAYCMAMTESLRVREAQILKLVVEYDSGYRSGLQFSGIFRAFLGQMRGVVLGSMRSATTMITAFSRVPCFIAACDDSPDGS
ncbi:MAG: hypothetical protein Greene041662_337 [Candidatus Peregrinibacteria bacterium Greene0416_62]|nr:MAG: hypothetical protein Greene041662_337 [Candidatus Peregrinibacteria bacterium Greene0416_62]TSD00298.1 MAG: hypothetical protein Greene101449_232 [Candidatus Peregrinibacteria bacterium Greene1014_49]